MVNPCSVLWERRMVLLEQGQELELYIILRRDAFDATRGIDVRANTTDS